MKAFNHLNNLWKQLPRGRSLPTNLHRHFFSLLPPAVEPGRLSKCLRTSYQGGPRPPRRTSWSRRPGRLRDRGQAPQYHRAPEASHHRAITILSRLRHEVEKGRAALAAVPNLPRRPSATQWPLNGTTAAYINGARPAPAAGRKPGASRPWNAGLVVHPAWRTGHIAPQPSNFQLDLDKLQERGPETFEKSVATDHGAVTFRAANLKSRHLLEMAQKVPQRPRPLKPLLPSIGHRRGAGPKSMVNRNPRFTFREHRGPNRLRGRQARSGSALLGREPWQCPAKKTPVRAANIHAAPYENRDQGRAGAFSPRLSVKLRFRPSSSGRSTEGRN